MAIGVALNSDGAHIAARYQLVVRGFAVSCSPKIENRRTINVAFQPGSRPWWPGQVTGLADERCAATKPCTPKKMPKRKLDAFSVLARDFIRKPQRLARPPRPDLNATCFASNTTHSTQTVISALSRA